MLYLPLSQLTFYPAPEGYVAFVLQNGNLTRSHYLPPQPSKGRRATPARQSRAASCYTTASSAAALGHLGAADKRGSGAKTARNRCTDVCLSHRPLSTRRYNAVET